MEEFAHENTCDVAVIGAGAAGLMAAIHAGRALRECGETRPRVIALDGAAKLGAKILVAGGGRCNVTHHAVDEHQYAGSSPPAIRKVLGRFGVSDTIGFFERLGVQLKREETGKLFPTTDRAHTILDALLRAARDAGVLVLHPWRVGSIAPDAGGFCITRESPGAGAVDGESSRTNSGAPGIAPGVIRARAVILATGGKSLPKTGSDGGGYAIARSLGHSLTPIICPALAPLTLPKGHWACELSGITLPTTIQLRSSTGKVLKSFSNSTLLTHFGLSGPGPLDISRFITHARAADPGAHTVVNFLHDLRPEQAEESLREQGGATGRAQALRWLTGRGIAERLARAICQHAGVDPAQSIAALSREQRARIVRSATACPVPVTGDRGYLFAEATAGGVPLAEVRLDTMESRLCPGLYVCGELCDVDGRIGGFNFQWAWASGYVAGIGAARNAPRMVKPD